MLGDEAPTRTLLDFAYGGDRGLLKAAFQTAVPRRARRRRRGHPRNPEEAARVSA
jgi:hypothetical protein